MNQTAHAAALATALMARIAAKEANAAFDAHMAMVKAGAKESDLIYALAARVNKCADERHAANRKVRLFAEA